MPASSTCFISHPSHWFIVAMMTMPLYLPHNARDRILESRLLCTNNPPRLRRSMTTLSSRHWLTQYRFKHIDLLLIRRPEEPDGAPRLTIRLRLEETKQYRGAKPM